MEFQTTLQNGKAYSCTPLHSHLDVKQPFQDFTVKKNPIYLSFTEQAQSIQRYTYIKKKIKGTFLLHGTGGWCQGTARGDDAAWSSSPLHQTGALLLADGLQGCCAVRDVIRPAARLSISPAPKLDLEMRQALILRNTAARDWGLKTGHRLKSRQDALCPHPQRTMREIVHIQAGQCGNQIGAKV